MAITQTQAISKWICLGDMSIMFNTFEEVGIYVVANPTKVDWICVPVTKIITVS